MSKKSSTPRNVNGGLGTHRRLLPKVANSIHKPLPEVATLGQLGGGDIRRGVPSVLIPVYDHVKGVGGRFHKSGVALFSGFASYSRYKKHAVFEFRRARSAIHSHGEEG